MHGAETMLVAMQLAYAGLAAAERTNETQFKTLFQCGVALFDARWASDAEAGEPADGSLASISFVLADMEDDEESVPPSMMDDVDDTPGAAGAEDVPRFCTGCGEP